MEELYLCIDCEWQGCESELEYDKVESCMGDDEMEVCPKCGSMNIKKKMI